MDKELDLLIDTYINLNLSKNIDYDKFNEFAIVHHSSSIEGSTLSEIETRLLLDEGLTPKGKPLEHSLMTKDHFGALQFVLKKADDHKQIGNSFIQSINEHVMENTGKIYETALGQIDGSKGEFRKGNVSAGDSYFVNYDKVEGLTSELITKINVGIDKNNTRSVQLNLAFDAHFDSLTIHPFYDGNGRTSRLLMNYILRIFSLPLSIVFKEDKVEYFKALVETRSEENIEIFRTFMKSQYIKYLNQEIDKYEQLKNPDKDSGYSLVF